MQAKTGWSTPHGDVPSKTAGKATHALQCSWISITAWWQHVCLCQERCNYIICGMLPRSQFEGTAVFLDHHDSLVAAWLSQTGALHGCVYDRTAVFSGEGYSKVKTTRKATGNHLGYFS